VNVDMLSCGREGDIDVSRAGTLCVAAPRNSGSQASIASYRYIPGHC